VLSSSLGYYTPLVPWWGFATSADRQRIEAFLRRGVRAGYRRADEPTAAQLVGDRDDELFDRIRRNVNHVLHALLPSQRTCRLATTDIGRKLRSLSLLGRRAGPHLTQCRLG